MPRNYCGDFTLRKHFLGTMGMVDLKQAEETDLLLTGSAESFLRARSEDVSVLAMTGPQKKVQWISAQVTLFLSRAGSRPQ